MKIRSKGRGAGKPARRDSTRERRNQYMVVVFSQYKPFFGSHSANRRKDSGLFVERSRIEALEREIAARIEADHDRPGRW